VGASRGRERLPRAQRLRRSGEIRSILRRGKRTRTLHLDVFDAPSPAAHPRVGLVVPRYRHPVVARNLVKRRIREALRREILPRLRALGLEVDILVRARREAYGASFATLRDELLHWLELRWSHAAS
jgi:ribonuclease P protein component